MSCLLIFPPVDLQLPLDLQPCAAVCQAMLTCVLSTGAALALPSQEKLQEFPGEQQEGHSYVPSPAPQHLHLFGLQLWGMPAVPVGVFWGRIRSDVIYLKLSELWTHTGLHRLLGSPVDSPCAEGTAH